MATPVWIEKENRWKLRESINGRLRVFTSSKAGQKGKAEVKRKRDIALELKADKASWRLEKCWTEYLIDVANRTGRDSENYVQREKIGRLYILPALGKAKMESISTADWQNIINNAKPTRRSKATGKLLRSELSKKTLKNIMGTITDFSGFAVRARMLESPPISLYVPKTAPVVGKGIIMPEQLEAVYKGAGTYWYGYAWLLMIVTGWRPGEVLGIKVDEIDGTVLRVIRSINSRRKITQGKNRRANRMHYINAFSRMILEAQKSKVAEKGIDSPWLFPSEEGDMPSPHRSYKQWIAFSSRLGISVPPYSLRHTHVSMMKEMPEAWLKMVLGHGQDMDTFGIYGHVINSDLQAASAMSEEIIVRYIKPDDI